MFKDKDSISTTRAARVFECSQQHVAKTLKDKCRIRCYKKKRIPKRTAQHLGKVRRLCGRLYLKLKGKSCAIDDEAYFTYAHSTINGNDNFYSDDLTQTPANVKYRKVGKFESKMLVYMCFSDKGSQSLISCQMDLQSIKKYTWMNVSRRN